MKFGPYFIHVVGESCHSHQSGNSNIANWATELLVVHPVLFVQSQILFLPVQYEPAADNQ